MCCRREKRPQLPPDASVPWPMVCYIVNLYCRTNQRLLLMSWSSVLTVWWEYEAVAVREEIDAGTCRIPLLQRNEFHAKRLGSCFLQVPGTREGGEDAYFDTSWGEESVVLIQEHEGAG